MTNGDDRSVDMASALAIFFCHGNDRRLYYKGNVDYWDAINQSFQSSMRAAILQILTTPCGLGRKCAVGMLFTLHSRDQVKKTTTSIPPFLTSM